MKSPLLITVNFTPGEISMVRIALRERAQFFENAKAPCKALEYSALAEVIQREQYIQTGSR